MTTGNGKKRPGIAADKKAEGECLEVAICLASMHSIVAASCSGDNMPGTPLDLEVLPCRQCTSRYKILQNLTMSRAYPAAATWAGNLHATDLHQGTSNAHFGCLKDKCSQLQHILLGNVTLRCITLGKCSAIRIVSGRHHREFDSCDVKGRT